MADAQQVDERRVLGVATSPPSTALHSSGPRFSSTLLVRMERGVESSDLLEHAAHPLRLPLRVAHQRRSQAPVADA